MVSNKNQMSNQNYYCTHFFNNSVIILFIFINYNYNNILT